MPDGDEAATSWKYRLLLAAPIFLAVFAALGALVYRSQSRLQHSASEAEEWLAGMRDEDFQAIRARLVATMGDPFVIFSDRARNVLAELENQAASAASDTDAAAWIESQSDEDLLRLTTDTELHHFQNPRLNRERSARVLALLPAAILSRGEHNLRSIVAEREAAKLAELQQEHDAANAAGGVEQVADAERVLETEFGFRPDHLRKLREVSGAEFPSPEPVHTWTHSNAGMGWYFRSFGLELFHWSDNWRLDFSPDGHLLAFGGNDGVTSIWHTETGERVATFQQDKQKALNKVGMLSHWITVGNTVQSLAFVPDSSLLLMPNFRRRGERETPMLVDVWNFSTQQRERQIEVLDTPASLRIQVTPEGDLVTRYGRWHAKSGEKRKQEFAVDLSQEPDCHAFSKDGTVLVVAQRQSGRPVIRCFVAGQSTPRWEIDSQTDLQQPTFAGSYQPARCIEFSDDDTTVAVTFNKGLAVALIDARTGECRVLPLVLSDGALPRTTDNHKIWNCDFSPDGRTLALIPTSNQLGDYLLLQDARSGRIVAALEHDNGVHQAKFSPDGHRLATVEATESGPTRVRLWRIDRHHRAGESVLSLLRFESLAKGQNYIPAGVREHKLQAAALQGAIDVIAAAQRNVRPAPPDGASSQTATGIEPAAQGELAPPGIPGNVALVSLPMDRSPRDDELVAYSVHGPYRIIGADYPEHGTLDFTLDQSGYRQIWFHFSGKAHGPFTLNYVASRSRYYVSQ